MIENIQFEVAKNSDIEGVIALQSIYLVSNMTEEEKASGFVTTPFSIEQLEEVIRQEGLFIAKEAANALNGELTLTPSQSGAHFVLMLPINFNH